MTREEVVIVPYQDGPYLVRGPVSLRDQDGRGIGVTRRPIALCRCGKSRMRPLCDGTHRLVGFCAPSRPESPWPEHASPPPALALPRAPSPSRERHQAGAAPGRAPAYRPHAIDQAKLVRALARAESLIAAAAARDTRVALRKAVQLIAAARFLLVQAAADPQLEPEAPSLCLIQEALTIVRSAPGGSDGFAGVVAMLISASTSLARSESWR